MEGEILKGHLDLILLAALSARPAHGYAVIDEIRSRSGQAFDLPEGTIYPALHRLEQAGLLASRWETAETGRKRRVYSLTGRGEGALAERRAVWQQFCDAVGGLFGRSPCRQETGVIPDYLDSLGAVLKFDRSLARRVRQEVEDHLWEAVAADPAGSEVEAQRRAIAAFGEPRVIAAQFAVVSLAARTRRAGGAMILLIGGVFLAMKARVAWYAVMDCIVGDDLKAISAVVGLVDRCSFWLSAVIAIGAWMYFSFHHSPARPQIAYRRQSRRFCLFCGVAAGALVVSVISDGVLTALRLPGPALSAEFLIPVLSILIEISCAAVLACQIGGVAQRAASMAALLKT